jgi:hypothetical protein
MQGAVVSKDRRVGVRDRPDDPNREVVQAVRRRHTMRPSLTYGASRELPSIGHMNNVPVRDERTSEQHRSTMWPLQAPHEIRRQVKDYTAVDRPAL